MFIANTFQSAQKIFFPDENLQRYAARHNANLAVHIGGGLAFLELLFVISALIRADVQFNAIKFVSYMVLGIASAVLSALSRRRLSGKVGPQLFMGYLITFLWIAAIYGITNSLQDFAEGKQIITFYMIIMMITCIFVTPPIGLITLVGITYVAIYLLGFSGGRMETGSVVLFWISSVVVVVAGLIRYNECRIAADNEAALQRMSSHDGLTGLKNRMALREDFNTMIGRDQYVIMADLDDFKKVNDTYGHDAGDAVLVAYANALREAFPNAACYRYGGDEFLLFSAVRPGEDVEKAARALSEGFCSVPLDTGECVRVGASLGFVRGMATDVSELRAQMRDADARLLAVKSAKKVGR